MRTALKVRILLVIVLLSGCSIQHEPLEVERCRELIEQSLVSPAATHFIEYIMVRHKAAEYRDFGTRAETEAIQAEVESIRNELAVTKVTGDRQALQALQARSDEVKKRLAGLTASVSQESSQPFSGVFWELDSPNRNGVMIRLMGACTWRERDDMGMEEDTFQLSALTEGRIPADMRKVAAGAQN